MKILAATCLGLCLVSATPAISAQADAPAPQGAPAAAAAPSTATAPAAAVPAVEPEALEALKRMSAYLGTLPAIGLTTNTSLDVVTVQGQRVQLDGVVNYKVRRPNAFVIDVRSDQKQRRFYYDGKQFTVYGPQNGFYATAAAPPTIRQTLAAIDEKYGIQLPLRTCSAGTIRPRTRPRTSSPASRWGRRRSMVFPRTTTHSVRRTSTGKSGSSGAPSRCRRRWVIVDRTDPAYPTYTARLAWTLNPSFSDADFAFQPGKDAKQIRLSELAK